MAESVLGSLCRETDWIWRRLIQIRSSQQRCSNSHLLNRLQAEFDIRITRCGEIQKISQRFHNQSKVRSLNLQFLDELVRRALSVTSHKSMIHP